MAPSRTTKPSAPPKKSKSKLSTLTLDAFPSSSVTKHSNRASTPLSSISEGSTNKAKKPLTSFAKPPAFQINGKGKGKEKIPSGFQFGGNRGGVEGVEDDQLWVDKYVPQTEAELAVHKKKIEDVRHWLNEALDGGPTGVLKKYRRILALTGHAGTGKTATLRVLAQEMDFDILEWRNSLDDKFSGEDDDYGRESLTQKFQTFLTRASSCRTIPLVSTSDSSSTAQLPSRQIILLEDLPNILHAGTAEAFHAALQDYLTSPPGVPLVCVISDAGTRGEDPESDMVGGRAWGKWGKQALDVRSVIPPIILNSPYFKEIQFNPIASTFMLKGLNTLLAKRFPTSTKSKSSMQPSKDIIQLIIASSHGDIRSAIMALQFACVVQLPKGNNKGEPRAVLEAVTRREQSLALFHMLGKILYNKRKGDPPNASATKKDREREEELDAKIRDPPPLPPHLEEHSRSGSRVDVNTLYADSPVDTSLFALYLHHNYTQFCNEMDECDGVCDWLSWIDSSGPESRQTQQNPHQFHILTLGVLNSLPSPVPRRSQKMFKPEFFDVLKKMREAEGCVEDTEGWLNSAITDEAVGGRRWPRQEVVLELGGVLKALNTCGMGPPPRTHSKFTALSFVHPAKLPNNSQRMEQLGESEEPTEDFPADDLGSGRSWGGVTQEKEDSGGWLDNDDIQDF